MGASWKDVIKVTKYLTDFREADAMHKTMHAYFGDWLPASTTVCINQLSSPGARIELDMIVALPKGAGKSSTRSRTSRCRAKRSPLIRDRRECRISNGSPGLQRIAMARRRRA